MNIGPVGLYAGPDQVLPIASALATVLGFLLLFWHKFVALLRKLARSFRRPASSAGIEQRPGRQPDE